MKLTLYGDPRTKKNSARILKSRSGGRFVAPSKAYVDYETDCLRQIKRPRSPISARVNVRCVYYMKTARRAVNAGAYMTSAVQLKVRTDHYLHSTTLRTPIAPPPSSNHRPSGGYRGGTTVNSRGFSGSSRKF